MAMLKVLLLFSAAVIVKVKSQAKPCNPKVCKLPDCFCSGTEIPGGLGPSETPQIILMGFEGGVTLQYWKHFQSLFDGKLKNPNGCNISATFFVSHEFTDYSMVQTLYHQRHEIADNTISRRLPISWWAKANYSELKKEIDGQREILRKWGNVASGDVRGFSAPYLQPGGNPEYKVLKDGGFLYDSTLSSIEFIHKPLWPYTLDYKTIQDCVVGPCPTDSFPGLWEVPLIDYMDREKEPCRLIDACKSPENYNQAYNLLYKNFELHYKMNKAPFPMFMQGSWLTNYSFTLNATKEFLKDVLAKGDVWVVGIFQAIQWIKSPTKLSDVKTFKPWQCKSTPPSVCSPQAVNTCVYPKHTFRTCTSPCPKNYPWVGNPDGN